LSYTEREGERPLGLVVVEAAASMVTEVASGEAVTVWPRCAGDVGEEESAM
jgi:hypothetical protein